MRLTLTLLKLLKFQWKHSTQFFKSSITKLLSKCSQILLKFSKHFNSRKFVHFCVHQIIFFIHQTANNLIFSLRGSSKLILTISQVVVKIRRFHNFHGGFIEPAGLAGNCTVLITRASVRGKVDLGGAYWFTIISLFPRWAGSCNRLTSLPGNCPPIEMQTIARRYLVSFRSANLTSSTRKIVLEDRELPAVVWTTLSLSLSANFFLLHPPFFSSPFWVSFSSLQRRHGYKRIVAGYPSLHRRKGIKKRRGKRQEKGREKGLQREKLASQGERRDFYWLWLGAPLTSSTRLPRRFSYVFIRSEN